MNTDTADPRLVIGKDYCTTCGDPVSEVGPMNAEDEGTPATAGMGEGMIRPPRLVGHDGGVGYNGEDLAEEVFELIENRLPLLDQRDPMKPTLHRLLPALGAALGRPRLLPVEPRPTTREA